MCGGDAESSKSETRSVLCGQGEEPNLSENPLGLCEEGVGWARSPDATQHFRLCGALSRLSLKPTYG